MSPRGRRARPRGSRRAGQAHGPATHCPATVGGHPECRRRGPHHCAVAPACGASPPASPTPRSRSRQEGLGAGLRAERRRCRDPAGWAQAPPREAADAPNHLGRAGAQDWRGRGAVRQEHQAGADPIPAAAPPALAKSLRLSSSPGAPRGGRGRGGPEAWGTLGVGKAGDPVLWGWRLHGEGAQARGGTRGAGRASLATGTRAGGETGAHGSRGVQHSGAPGSRRSPPGRAARSLRDAGLLRFIDWVEFGKVLPSGPSLAPTHADSRL